ncbi:hypothetical protein [Methylophaga nitratireducenticrescens]|uniref:Uncharacterized protein n=1 Tax=Methylophaga nitratireducenticrescens TaxID=754476 RepID=I1XN80_METNJ|nr:hypothetical protein [Methylophaga nitratireducenticrescens]AFI85849.1 hypothetical protein Q7A_3076 [Methylophaga nitratireducenticrescens]AUZ85557.1 hypothetical protein CDW43_13730 [Methylophaga nitratireducenticrescens]
MDLRKLSLILMLMGIAFLLLSLVWFFVAYASTLDTITQYGDKDLVMQMMACVYSSPPICQGAAFLSDGPSYSPVVFWLGIIMILVGVIVFFALNSQINQTHPLESMAGEHLRDGKILGLIAKEKYTHYSYMLFLIGAGGGLLLPPLAVTALMGFVLAVLGYFVYSQLLTSLDKNHLAMLSMIYLASTLVIILTMGSALFLLAALVQLALYYIGFNSYRLGRSISANNLKEEAILAFKPIRERFSSGKKD